MSLAHSLPHRVRSALAAITGHSPEDLDAALYLEGDLGIDSIKMVEIVQSLAELVPATQRARFAADVPTEQLMQLQTIGEVEACLAPYQDDAAPVTRSAPTTATTTAPTPRLAMPVDTPAPTSAATGAATPAVPSVPAASAVADRAVAVAVAADESALRQAIFRAVSGVSGHRPEDLEPDLGLESDLGIDSIKMVELSQVLASLVPVARRAAFAEQVPSEQLMQLQTLREIMELLLPWQEARSPAAQTVAAALSPSPSPSLAPSPSVAQQSSPVLPPASAARRVAILPSQYVFLVSHAAVSTCSLLSRVRLQGPFSIERARQAWQALLDRQPALRSRFQLPSGTARFDAVQLHIPESVSAPALQVHDLQGLSTAEQDRCVAERVSAGVNHRWTLDEPLLHRFEVLRLDPQLHELHFHNHHLISDGLGNQQVMREFLALYARLEGAQDGTLSDPVSLDAYARLVEAFGAWQDEAEDQALASLLKQQGKQAFVWNPKGVARANAQVPVSNHRLRLDPATTSALLQLTQAVRVPMNTLLVAAYLRTVATWVPEQPTLIINIPTSGRLHGASDAGQMVGCFAQNLALDFAAPRADEPWPALLERVQARLVAAIAGGCDRAQTRQAAHAIRHRMQLVDGGLPAAQAAVIRAGLKSNLYLPYIGNTQLAECYGPLRVVDYQAATVTNAGTLDTVIELFQGRLEMTTNYDAQHFEPQLVAQVGEAFLTQLRALAAVTAEAPRSPAPAPADAGACDEVLQLAGQVMHRPLTPADLPRDLEAALGLDSLERIRIASHLLARHTGLDRSALLGCRTLADMAAQLSQAAAPVAVTTASALPIYLQIAEQCARTPQAVAVLTEQGSLSYGQLHQSSNRLAHHLRTLGVTQGARVGVMLNRGSDLMVALLAVMKAGAAYVPLDPDYPQARLRYIVGHAGLEVLITEQTLADVLKGCLAPGQVMRDLVYMDGNRPAQVPGGLNATSRQQWMVCADADLAPLAGLDDPMVVLYTSGSTGTPKGVLLAHRGYVNRHAWHQALFALEPGERVAQKTSVCFDISVWELFWPLQHGGVVCPVSTAVLRDPWALAEWMRRTQIHVMHFVPSLFGEFLGAMASQRVSFPQLRQLVFSGEALPVALVQRWFQRFGAQARLANLYGPTEASIDVSAWQMDAPPPLDMLRVPIGHAMPGTQLIVLDEAMQPVPAGTPGELWIGGVQLAQGYLNDPVRTAESFRDNPFPHIAGSKLYRTGDLVVELPDGAFDYRGRLDTQVKIRGFRVELGEVEAALSACPGVHEVAVLAIDHDDGHLRLAAWLSGQPVDDAALQAHLAQRLPSYMLPRRYAWLDSLPKNQNGKLDRKALRALVQPPSAAVVNSGSVAPLATLPQTPLKRAGSEEQHILAGTLDHPLGPAQHWLLSYFEAPHLWAGYTRFSYLQALDLPAFNRALQRITLKHPALRTVLTKRQGSWLQHFPAPLEPVLAEVYDGASLSQAQLDTQIRGLVTERIRALRLDGPGLLWKVLLVRVDATRWDVCVLGHHIISDMLSNSVLFKSLWQEYGAVLAGDDGPVVEENPLLTDYLEHLEKLRTRENTERFVSYWRERFGAPHAPFRIPLDHPQGSNTELSHAQLKLQAPVDTRSALQTLRGRLNCSLYTLMLAPLYRLLAEWSGQQRVVVSQRSHGRDFGDGHCFFDCVGDFAVNYPLAQTVDADWGRLIRQLSQDLAEVPLKGISYDLVARSLPEGMYPDARLTPVRANYLGQRELPNSSLFAFQEGDWDQRFALPDQIRSCVLEFFFQLQEGGLQIDVGYSTALHDPATIDRLGQRYLALLGEMLQALREQPVTPVPVSAEPAAAPQVSSLVSSQVPSQVPVAVPSQVPVAVPGPLSGKVALVTGAGRGIGQRIAEKLAAQGAAVVMVSRSESQLQEAAAAVRAQGGEVMAVCADVTRVEEVDGAVAQAVQRYGGLDILINNAGANHAMLLSESDPAAWRALVDVNLMAAYYCCRAAVPHMVRRGGGKVVNLGSAASVIGYPLFSAYSASKHAVVGLTKALAEEVKQQNIQVNVVCPAFVDTRMTPQAFRGISMPIDQVAEVLLFLSGAASDGITGESLNIFGRQDMYAYGSEKLNAVKLMTRDFRPGVTA